MLLSSGWAFAHLLLVTSLSFVNAGCHNRIPQPTPQGQRAFAAIRVTSPEITSAPVPQNLKRQAGGSQFIGWESESAVTGSSYEPISCVGNDVWTVSNGYGNCCPTNECTWYTLCDATVAYAPGGAQVCPTNEVCNTWPIYPSLGADEFIAWVGCASFEATFYIASPTPTPTTSTIAPVTTTSPISSSASASSSHPASSGGSKTNIGAIVGGVVGGVAFLGLLALIGFLVWMHHRKSAQNDTNPPNNSGVTPLVGEGAGEGKFSPTVQSSSGIYTPTPEYSHFPPQNHQLAMGSSPTNMTGQYYQTQGPVASELPSGLTAHSPVGYYPSQSPVGGMPPGQPHMGQPQHGYMPPQDMVAPIYVQVPHQPSPATQ